MNRTNIDHQADTLQEKLDQLVDTCDGLPNNCPTRLIVDRFSDKWSMLAIVQLGQAGTLRFNTLKKNINGISQRMLTVTLRSLERDGLVWRRVYPQIPPRVEYELTPLGQSLLAKIIELGEWASNHSGPIVQARARYDANESRGKDPLSSISASSPSRAITD